MKKIVFILLFISGGQHLFAQTIKDLIKQKTKLLTQQSTTDNSGNEIANALKQALTIGAEKGSAALAQPDGFFKNAALKILLPPEAQKIESTLRSVGMNKQVDEAILSINRAAEDACKTAAPIFVSAIKEMTVTDAVNILKGADTAATSYLKRTTTAPLTSSFKPIIESSLQKTDATKHWNTLVSAYNKFSLRKLNPSLSDYVTQKALDGIYTQIAAEEKNIRQNPAARATDLLKKVFGGINR
ncbi:MAG: DUF4197 domain-containing protein [Sediminibacterium sp.]|jgi:hypothetical protein